MPDEGTFLQYVWDKWGFNILLVVGCRTLVEECND
jgi:hypothetical protein